MSKTIKQLKDGGSMPSTQEPLFMREQRESEKAAPANDFLTLRITMTREEWRLILRHADSQATGGFVDEMDDDTKGRFAMSTYTRFASELRGGGAK